MQTQYQTTAQIIDAETKQAIDAQTPVIQIDVNDAIKAELDRVTKERDALMVKLRETMNTLTRYELREAEALAIIEENNARKNRWFKK